MVQSILIRFKYWHATFLILQHSKDPKAESVIYICWLQMCIFWGQVSKLNSIFILSLHISSLSSRFLSSGSRANLLSRFLIILNPDFLWFWIQISSYFWIQISRRRLLTSVLLLSKVILTLCKRKSVSILLMDSISISRCSTQHFSRNMSWKILDQKFRLTFSSIQRRQSGGMAVEGGQWANENIISALWCAVYSVQCTVSGVQCPV